MNNEDRHNPCKNSLAWQWECEAGMGLIDLALTERHNLNKSLIAPIDESYMMMDTSNRTHGKVTGVKII